MKELFIILLLLPIFGRAQAVHQIGWENFWTMRDSVNATTDTAWQRDLVNRLYISPASEGLKAFMRNKDGLDRKWLALLKADPAFWDQ